MVFCNRLRSTDVLLDRFFDWNRSLSGLPSSLLLQNNRMKLRANLILDEWEVWRLQDGLVSATERMPTDHPQSIRWLSDACCTETGKHSLNLVNANLECKICFLGSSICTYYFWTSRMHVYKLGVGTIYVFLSLSHLGNIYRIKNIVKL